MSTSPYPLLRSITRVRVQWMPWLRFVRLFWMYTCNLHTVLVIMIYDFLNQGDWCYGILCTQTFFLSEVWYSTYCRDHSFSTACDSLHKSYFLWYNFCYVETETIINSNTNDNGNIRFWRLVSELYNANISISVGRLKRKRWHWLVNLTNVLKSTLKMLYDFSWSYLTIRERKVLAERGVQNVFDITVTS